jgi:hypothetical protein
MFGSPGDTDVLILEEAKRDEAHCATVYWMIRNDGITGYGGGYSATLWDLDADDSLEEPVRAIERATAEEIADCIYDWHLRCEAEKGTETDSQLAKAVSLLEWATNFASLNDDDECEQFTAKVDECKRFLKQHSEKAKATEPSFVWLATCEDIFGGYGIRAMGRTRQEASDALFAIYRETSETWNRGEYHLNEEPIQSFDELDEQWGVRVGRYELGKGFFGEPENCCSGYEVDEASDGTIVESHSVNCSEVN